MLCLADLYEQCSNRQQKLKEREVDVKYNEVHIKVIAVFEVILTMKFLSD